MNYDKLEEIRKQKGISVSELARKLDINRSTWYRWINKESNAPMDKIFQACKIIGIDISALIE